MTATLPSSQATSPRRQGRLTWAVRMAGEAALKTALTRDASEQAVHLTERHGADVVHVLAEMIMERADPTSNKQFTPWLVREYAAGRLILEDLGTANETLTLFLRYAPRLKPEARDIQRYGSLAAAWEAVRGFAERDEAHSNKAQKTLDRAKAYEESRILRQDPDGFTMAVPLTEFAAKWWGKGTRWCTAAEKDNAFEYYHKQAPLIVMLIPDMGKFQLWVTEASYQLADAADKAPSAEVIERGWPYFETIIPPLLRQSGLLLELFPTWSRTEEWCRVAIEQNGLALKHTPPEFVNQDLCLAAVRSNGFALKYVPKTLQTQELCQIAVAQNGYALQFLPEELLLEEACQVAVTQNGGALWIVPAHLRTERVCSIAVAQNGGALEHVPPDLLIDDLCRIAVSKDGNALAYVPDKLKTDELLRLAVAQSGKAIRHIPPALRTEEICRIALAQDGWAIEYVPGPLLNRDLCLVAVAQDGKVLRDIPVPDAELCRVAVAQHWVALVWVPQPLRTEEICRLAVGQNAAALADVPAPLLPEMSSLVSTAKPGALQPEDPGTEWPMNMLDTLEQAFAPKSLSPPSGHP